MTYAIESSETIKVTASGEFNRLEVEADIQGPILEVEPLPETKHDDKNKA